MDITEFYQTFFEEAEELLAQMEQLLLELDIDQPDSEHLNAIFRAAHSIKGGAATFGFVALTDTTHLLENLLDRARHNEIRLSRKMIDAFLNTKDALQEQIEAYASSGEPDPARVAEICAVLQQLAIEQGGGGDANGHTPAKPATTPTPAPVATAPEPAVAGNAVPMRVQFLNISTTDAALLRVELANLGTIVAEIASPSGLTIWLDTPCVADDITIVCCFIIEMDQIKIDRNLPQVTGAPEASGTIDDIPVLADAIDNVEAFKGPDLELLQGGKQTVTNVASTKVPANANVHTNPNPVANKESGTIRVDVEKVDQIINLVGELVITQSMLAQNAASLDPVLHERLLSGMSQLERNARDLQESVMSVRMMQMDYVFSRFPRLVRDLSAKLGKEIQLDTYGKATELDKSLIERIVDPLTHLVRNSLDHGIERGEQRIAAGKNPVGRLLLSAQHQGGNIVIEVSDDGAGLNRERILAKAKSQGMDIADNIADEDVWQLIFAPGFSTAEKVTDVSGRGVGMDVVKRNIQQMGGQVEISSKAGMGTTTRIILPLTLAILDGMSVKVGDEVYILPLNYVIESLQPRAEDIHSIAADEHVLHVRGEYLPLKSLHNAFNVANARLDPTTGIVVILQGEGKRFALLVDQLVGQHQVVVKNLETNYRKVPGISAATILGDGSVALIVDVVAVQKVNTFKDIHADIAA